MDNQPWNNTSINQQFRKSWLVNAASDTTQNGNDQEITSIDQQVVGPVILASLLILDTYDNHGNTNCQGYYEIQCVNSSILILMIFLKIH